jgi:hypothetical protein
MFSAFSTPIFRFRRVAGKSVICATPLLLTERNASLGQNQKTQNSLHFLFYFAMSMADGILVAVYFYALK